MVVATYAIGFNMLCAYNLQSTFAAFDFYNPATTPMVIGAVLAVLVGWVLFGGLIGLLISYELVNIINVVSTGNAPVIKPDALVISMIFALSIGLIAGFYPALKAARLDPIQALRYE